MQLVSLKEQMPSIAIPNCYVRMEGVPVTILKVDLTESGYSDLDVKYGSETCDLVIQPVRVLESEGSYDALNKESWRGGSQGS